MILPVVMAGGTGTRLWPLSRATYPKQFIRLTSSNSILQETLLRLRDLDTLSPTLICNENHRFIAAEQIRQLGVKDASIILEPVGRNTAPAIALAAFKAMKTEQDPIMLVLASDHDIKQPEIFCDVVKSALPLAESGKLITFGIVPTYAETGYGYIKAGASVNKNSNACQIASFVEKPNVETAKHFLQSGGYYWNSGMFMFKASCYLDELKHYRPDIYSACEIAMAEEQQDMDFVRVNAEAFKACPDESIDYAVMEKTEDAFVVPLDVGWSDLGGFAALHDIKKKDNQGNAFIGDVKSVDTKNTLVISDHKLVATVGIENLVIVNTKDAVLVAKKDECQQVKAIVNQLKSEQRSEFEFSREVYRPWGSYDSIDNGKRYQVKRITVKPGAKLSVQMHHHRAEHWIVVSGTAKVTNGDKELLLTENQSTFIPVGVVHALENPGKVPLELIEVQSGSYLGEDDIVRFEDKYGRV